MQFSRDSVPTCCIFHDTIFPFFLCAFLAKQGKNQPQQRCICRKAHSLLHNEKQETFPSIKLLSNINLENVMWRNAAYKHIFIELKKNLQLTVHFIDYESTRIQMHSISIPWYEDWVWKLWFAVMKFERIFALLSYWPLLSSPFSLTNCVCPIIRRRSHFYFHSVVATLQSKEAKNWVVRAKEKNFSPWFEVP